MSRHDQYGTHDDHAGKPSLTGPQRAREMSAVSPLKRGGPSVGEGFYGQHEANFGSGTERAVRTSSESQARFEGRDYERDYYGGGYGVQRETPDVPAGERKGEWMHEPARRGAAAPPPKRRGGNWTYPGQIAGEGMEGLASERAFGTEEDQQMSKMDHDAAYRRWRDAELRAHDEEYRAWRREQVRRYDEDFARWKSGQGRGGRGF